MRWSGQRLSAENVEALPGLARLNNLVRSVQTPEFAGVTFHEVLAKSALNKVPGGGGALPFSWTINPYRGCQHACTYCFARPTHGFMGLSAGLDFETRIFSKPNAAELLRRQLGRPRGGGVLADQGMGVGDRASHVASDVHQRQQLVLGERCPVWTTGDDEVAQARVAGPHRHHRHAGDLRAR